MALQHNLLKKCYLALVVLTLLFHVFNNFQITEEIKVFHLFAISSIFVGLLIPKKKDNLVLAFAMIIVWALVTSLFTQISASYVNMLKFLIISLSLLFIPFVSFKKLVLFVNCIIPFVLVCLVLDSIKNFIFRYQGFYEDPNYFCTTLLVFYFYIQLLWNSTSKTWHKILLLIEILIIAYLIAISISRTGMSCFVLMTIAFWWELFLHNKIKTIVSIIILFFVVYYFYKDVIDVVIEGFNTREASSNDDFGSASTHRWKISQSGLTFIVNHPLYWLQGIGIGSFRHGYELEGWRSYTNLIDHNTLTCWFTEQGIIGIALLFRFFWLLFRRLKKNKYLKSLKLTIPSITVFVVFIIFSASINQTNYFPFWFLLLTLVSLSNEKMINKQPFR